MSASAVQPPAHGREGGSDRVTGGHAVPTRARKSLLVGCAAVLLASGCNGGKTTVTDPTASPSSATPSPTATTADEQQLVLDQYRKFWASLTNVSRMPASERPAALFPFTVDPELKSLLAGMKATDAKGQVFYGAAVPRAITASLSPNGSRAVVDDCQDSRNSGLARRSDMAPLTKGVARNHVVVTMKQSGDVWKVYFVSYSKTPC
jgi:hypothetical protein